MLLDTLMDARVQARYAVRIQALAGLRRGDGKFAVQVLAYTQDKAP